MSRSRSKYFNRSDKVRFVGIPHNVWSHQDFRNLSPKATKLMLDIYGQYNGKNNGDFEMTKKTMFERGWNSMSQLYKAREELIEKELVIQTRQGGKNRCSLYAVTWRNIDECNGKLEVRPTNGNVRIFHDRVPNPSSH